jgi:hypothetical protein
MSAHIESKQMTYHNTPQLSGMDSVNHCTAFPGLSALSTTTIQVWPSSLNESNISDYNTLITERVG